MLARSTLTALLCPTLAVTLAVGFVPRTVAASAPAKTSAGDPEALSAEAVEAFSAKRYDESIELFNAAYEADPQPNYLFNIGRVYEEKGDLDKAVEFYTKFVGQPGVDIEARENATARLKVLRAAAKEMHADDEPETTEPEPLKEPSPVQETDEGPSEKTKNIRIAGYSLMGVGGVALIVGGVMGGLALGKTRDADDAEFVDDAAALRRDAKSQARAADALYITGGALAAVGVIMVLSTLGKRGKKGGKATARRTQFAPAWNGSEVGVMLRGRF